MRDSGFLIVNKKGIVGFRKGGNTKYDRKTPALAAGERAVFISVEVPESAFSPRPTPQATIVVPEEKLAYPAVDVIINDPESGGADG